MLTEAQKETIRGYSAFQLWLQEEGNAEKNYEDYKAWIKKDALDAAQTALNATNQTNKVKKETEQVKKETEDVQARTDQVRINTLTTKLDTEDILNETKQVSRNIEQTRIETLATNDATGKTRNETNQTQIRTDQTRIKTLTTKLDTEDILNETWKVKDTTDLIRIKTVSTQNATGQTNAETKKTEIRTDQTRIETLKLKQSTEKVLKEAKESFLKNESLIIRTRSVADETEQVKRETKTVSSIAKELNEHPPKPIGGYWFCWNIEKKDYVNSNIQAKGEVGSSFKIVGRYDTLEVLKSSVPNGADIDGVFAVGSQEPYSYYAWLVVDGVWQWDNQGQLRGAQGKSAFDVWLEDPANTGKTIIDFFNFLSPYVGDNKNWWVRDHDSGVPAEGISVNLQVLKNTPAEYILKFIYADGEEITPNLQGHSCNAVQDIDHIPGEDDTSFVYEGVTYNHSVGDRRRYYNPKKKKYEMYTLMDIDSEGKATWEIAGSGDADGIVFLSAPAHLKKSYITIKNGGLEE